jgi:hypothetical protein
MIESQPEEFDESKLVWSPAGPKPAREKGLSDEEWQEFETADITDTVQGYLGEIPDHKILIHRNKTKHSLGLGFLYDSDNKIIYMSPFWGQPLTRWLTIVGHEVGHAISHRNPHKSKNHYLDEANAWNLARDIYGSKEWWDEDYYKRCLQEFIDRIKGQNLAFLSDSKRTKLIQRFLKKDLTKIEKSSEGSN